MFSEIALAADTSETLSVADTSETLSVADTSKISTAEVLLKTAQAAETSKTGPTISLEPALSESSYLKNDIGLWPDVITSENIEYYLKMDIKALQNCDDNLFDSKSFRQIDNSSKRSFIRKCQISFFERKTKNGETIKRSWLCFSPSNGHLFCFVCKLFSQTRSQFTHDGYCDWKNTAARLVEHEISKNHLNAVINFTARSREIGDIDKELTEQGENEAKTGEKFSGD